MLRAIVKLCGKRQTMRLAEDHGGEVLTRCVTWTKAKKAALRFLKKAILRYGGSEFTATDGFLPYGAVLREIEAAGRQKLGRRLNKRVENSRQPLRRRKRAKLRFRRVRTWRKFVTVHTSVHHHFNQERARYRRQKF